MTANDDLIPWKSLDSWQSGWFRAEYYGDTEGFVDAIVRSDHGFKLRIKLGETAGDFGTEWRICHLATIVLQAGRVVTYLAEPGTHSYEHFVMAWEDEDADDDDDPDEGEQDERRAERLEAAWEDHVPVFDESSSLELSTGDSELVRAATSDAGLWFDRLATVLFRYAPALRITAIGPGEDVYISRSGVDGYPTFPPTTDHWHPVELGPSSEEPSS